MPVGYQLVNLDKKETIGFARIDTGRSFLELSGTVVFGSLLSYYMLKNIGDKITFANDCEDDFYFSEFILHGRTFIVTEMSPTSL